MLESWDRSVIAKKSYFIGLIGEQELMAKRLRPYFRRYSEKDRSIIHLKKVLDDELTIVNNYKQNDIHSRTQEVLLSALNKLITEGKNIDWYFKDDRLSDFPLSGNLLSDVTHAVKEHKIYPPL